MKVTFFGHSCVQVTSNGSDILFDPFISPNEKAKHIDLEQIRPDTIFLTHGHQDHMADAVQLAKKSNALVIANFEVANWIAAQGVENITPVNQGGTISGAFGKAKVVHAVHSSSLPDGTYGGNPLGYVLTTPEGTLYHSGDTALTYDMKLIPESSPIDAAALCIGDHFTMGVEDAITCAQWLGVKKVLGLHYDTFPPIEIDHEAAQKAFSAQGIELLLPPIGDTVEL